jgi:arylsulfatase A-like enzyme
MAAGVIVGRTPAPLSASSLGVLASALVTEPPNVVLMMDNSGCGEIGAHCGGALRRAAKRRPEALAAEGLKRLNSNVAPECRSSRSPLMTGRHPVRTGKTQGLAGLAQGLVAWEPSVVELFSGTGHRTGMSGKRHLRDQPRLYPSTIWRQSAPRAMPGPQAHKAPTRGMCPA